MSTVKSQPTAGKYFYGLATLLMILGLLYFGKPVLVPTALSILLAFTLTPLVEMLERWRLGRTASVLSASVCAFALIGLATWALVVQFKNLAVDLPNHTLEIKKKISALQLRDGSTLGRLSNMFKEVFPDQSSHATVTEGDVAPVPPIVVMQEANNGFGAVSEIVLPILEPLATASLVVVLVMFLLLRREDVRFRLISLMGDAALTGTTRLMADTATRVSKFLLHLLLVNAGFGVWFGVGLYLLGVPYAMLWGFLTLCLRFIPFLGSPASVVFPLLISIATSDGWTQPIWLIVFFGVSELISANFIEPILFGKTTGLTPIALLVAALFWAWIWGPIGLLLSTPLTVCLVVLGQHLPHLRSLKVLLAEQPILDARLQYFQRLLAKDLMEAQRVFMQYAKEFGKERACDEVLLPALIWTRRERTRDSISSGEENAILESTATAVASLSVEPDKRLLSDDAVEPLRPDDDPRAGLTGRRALEIFGYPVHHASEVVALAMIEKLLEIDGTMTIGSVKELPSKVVAKIVANKPDVVVLCVMPPGGLPQLKFMCSEIRAHCQDTTIIVAYFGKISAYDSLLVKVRGVGASYLTTSLAQTVHQISSAAAEVGTEGISRPFGASPPPHEIQQKPAVTHAS